ncbi:MAG: hypothetical protein AMJ56_13365 [Anaerolineae bacterium SG8_19]|nr:MAG: hypothetical protein AMJ56_13365 [Anaerolineae bacterium SG8_19]
MVRAVTRHDLLNDPTKGTIRLCGDFNTVKFWRIHETDTIFQHVFARIEDIPIMPIIFHITLDSHVQKSFANVI